MLSFFLKILKQKCGSYVCVQLLQTLNILFENIRNETSLCKLTFYSMLMSGYLRREQLKRMYDELFVSFYRLSSKQ